MTIFLGILTAISMLVSLDLFGWPDEFKTRVLAVSLTIVLASLTTVSWLVSIGRL